MIEPGTKSAPSPRRQRGLLNARRIFAPMLVVACALLLPNIAGVGATSAAASPPLSIGSAAASHALAMEPCLAAEAAAIERALGVELHHRLAVGSRERGGAPRFVLGCEGERIKIRVYAARSSRMLERTLDVSSTPAAARHRLTAVAAAELAESLWAEPPVTPSAPPAAVVSVPAPRGAPTTQVRALFDLRSFHDGPGLFPGLGLGVARDGGAVWGGILDLVVNRTSQDLMLGRGTAVLISARPAITASRRRERLEVFAAAGARIGLARIAGQPGADDVTGSTWWGWWGGPSAGAGAVLNLWARTSVSALVEGGWCAVNVVGREAGTRAVSISGPWLGAQVGFGWK